MKNVLITGGAGFIGTNLALQLIKGNYKVTVLDNFSPQIHGADYTNSPLYQSIVDKVEIVKGSIIEKDLLEDLIQKNEIIVHLAAETGTGQSMYEIQHYSNINIQGTALLLDLITNKKNVVEKIVVASSRAIYGEGKYMSKEHGIVYPTARSEKFLSQGDFNAKCPISDETVALMPTSENSKIHPTSIYGITKQVQEQMVMIMGESLGLPTTALRYQNVYGPGQSLKNPYTGILSIFSTRILNGNEINIFEDGQESRDFVFIDDIVNATILAIEKEEANNEVFNVGSGVGTSVEQVAKMLYQNYNVEPNYTITGNYRLGDIRHNIADLEKIKTKLNFQPSVSFAQGLEQFTNWVKTQQVQEDNFELSMDEMKSKGLLK